MGDVLPDGPLGGLLAVTFYSLVLVASFGALLYMYEIAVMLERLAVRVLPRPTLPAHPPIEQVARNARRVHADLLALTPGTRWPGGEASRRPTTTCWPPPAESSMSRTR